MCDIRKEMKERARLARGQVNALGYDIEYVYTDVENFDLLCLGESLHESKLTIQSLLDNVTELEYLLYLIKRDGSR